MIKVPPGSHGIVYVRVSTAHQAEDELPVDSQIAELKAAVAAAGATCEVVTDAGISGTDFEHRPGLQEIVARAREPKPKFQLGPGLEAEPVRPRHRGGAHLSRRPAKEGHRAHKIQGADPRGDRSAN